MNMMSEKKHAFPLMNGNPIRDNRPAYKTNQLLEIGRNLNMIMIKKNMRTVHLTNLLYV